MSTKKIYLAHPYESHKRVRNMQMRIQQALKTSAVIINPFYDTELYTLDDLENIAIMRGSAEQDASAVVAHDLKWIAQCDAIIAVVDGSPSAGTFMEIVYGRILGKPIFLLIRKEWVFHPWLRHHCNAVVTTECNLILHLGHYTGIIEYKKEVE